MSIVSFTIEKHCSDRPLVPEKIYSEWTTEWMVSEIIKEMALLRDRERPAASAIKSTSADHH
jgi:hypothetical protein